MSMALPRTTLTRGQQAPLLHRPCAAPRLSLLQLTRQEFLRRDLLQPAVCFANPLLAFVWPRQRRPSSAKSGSQGKTMPSNGGYRTISEAGQLLASLPNAQAEPHPRSGIRPLLAGYSPVRHPE